jgi:hypothetical protein
MPFAETVHQTGIEYYYVDLCRAAEDIRQCPGRRRRHTISLRRPGARRAPTLDQERVCRDPGQPAAKGTTIATFPAARWRPVYKATLRSSAENASPTWVAKAIRT